MSGCSRDGSTGGTLRSAGLLIKSLLAFLLTGSILVWFSNKTASSNDIKLHELRPYKLDIFKKPEQQCIRYLNDYDYAASFCDAATLKFTPRFLSKSLQNRTIAFVGDSRIRDIFVYLKSLLAGVPFRIIQFYNDVDYFSPRYNVTLEFFWCRFPDAELTRLLLRWKLNIRPMPGVIILAFGAWSVDKKGPTSLPRFSEDVERASQVVTQMRNRTVPIWMKTLPVTVNTSYDTWVKHNDSAATVEKFGESLEGIAHRNLQLVWSTAYTGAKTHIDLYRDHVHPGKELVAQFVCQLLSALDCGLTI